jgi:hypothetical protein
MSSSRQPGHRSLISSLFLPHLIDDDFNMLAHVSEALAVGAMLSPLFENG